MFKYLLMGLLLTTPTWAGDSIYDGPVAIKPLTVVAKEPVKPIRAPHDSPIPKIETVPAKPATVQICDYQNHCYAGGNQKSVPKPIVRAPVIPSDDPPIVAWKNCMSQALGNYYQNHNKQALQAATNLCQNHLGSPQSSPSDNFAQVRADGRRDIGCGYWPVGSDADRNCAEGNF